MRRDTFQAIADPTRRAIISFTINNPTKVSDIAKEFNITRQAISQQLKILQECELIEFEQNGRERICIARPENLEIAHSWLNQYQGYWKIKLSNLKGLSEEIENK